MEQQLNTFRQDVLLKIQNLKDEIKDSNKTIREAIKNQTLELKQKIRVSIVNQTNLGRQLHGEINNLTLEFKGLAAQINQTDEGRIKVHFQREKS